jgi:hypothetical protein
LSSIKQENDLLFAKEHYSQRVSAINDPVLKMMSFTTTDRACDLSKDEGNTGKLRNVKHEGCLYFKREDRWSVVHHQMGCDNINTEELKLDGQASAKDTSIIYPCNLKNCSHCCQCAFF